jgi:hypothetical protein
MKKQIKPRLLILLAALLISCTTTPTPAKKTTVSGSVSSQGISVVDIDSIRGISSQGISVVDIDSIRFPDDEIVAVDSTGAVQGSSKIMADGTFAMEVPASKDVALVIAKRDSKSGFLCQQTLGYQDLAGDGSTIGWRRAILSTGAGGNTISVGQFGFNELNGQLAADNKPAELTGDAAFASGSYENCGNANSELVTLKVKYNFNLPDPNLVDPAFKNLVPANQAAFLKFGMALALDTTPKPDPKNPKRNLAPSFIGTSNLNRTTGEATIVVRKEKGTTLTLTPVVGDTCLFNAKKCNFSTGGYRALVPLDDFGAAPKQITGTNNDFGTLSTDIAILPGSVKDKNGQDVAGARVSARLGRGEISTTAIGVQALTPSLPLSIAVSNGRGTYAMLLPVQPKIPYVLGAVGPDGAQQGIANGGQVDVTSQTPPEAPPIILNPPSAAQPPTNVDTFKAEQVTTLKLRLSWTGGSGATSYDILCKKAEDGDDAFAIVKEGLPAGTTEFLEDLPAEELGKALVFRLVSKNAAGSVTKDTLIRLVDLRPSIASFEAVQTGIGTVRLNWEITRFAPNASLKITRDGTMLTGVAQTATGSLVDLGRAVGNVHTYELTATNGAGSVSASKTITLVRPGFDLAIDNPDPARLGESRKFTATITGIEDKTVTWEASPALAPTAFTGTTANYTFATKGTYTITARSVAAPSLTKSLDVIVGLPIIKTATPSSGRAGTVVTLNGFNLDYAPVVVKTGGVDATNVTPVTGGKSLSFKVADCGCNSGPKPIVVSTSNGTSADFPFDYIGGTTTITITAPTSGNIVIEEPTTFTAVVRDGNNQVVTGQNIQWASSNTNVAVVNASTGVVTAKKFGTAIITAALASNTSINTSKTISPYGLQVRGGTVYQPGSALEVRPYFGTWFVPDPPASASAGLKTPAVSRLATAGATQKGSVSAQALTTMQVVCPSLVQTINVSIGGFSSSGFINLPAPNGQCSATINLNNKTYKSFFSINNSQKQNPVTNVIITTPPNQVAATWTPAAGAQAYFLYIFNSTGAAVTTVFSSTSNSAGTIPVSGGLPSGDYFFCVDAYSFDDGINPATVPDQVNVGGRCQSFTIGNVGGSLKASGGVSLRKLDNDAAATTTFISNTLSASATTVAVLKKNSSVTPQTNDVTITGPSGWGPVNVPLGSAVGLNNLAPASGNNTYNASYNDGSQTYNSMFQINAGLMLPITAGFNVGAALVNQVPVSWSSNAGAAAYRMALFNNSGSNLLAQSDYLATNTTSFTLTSLSLATNTPYLACIKAYSQNPSTSTGNGQINESVWCKTFSITPVGGVVDSVGIIMPAAATDGKLAIGENFVFTAQALDSNSVVIPSQSFTWNFNGDPSEIVAQTNTTITIKPKRFGSFTLEAVSVSNSNKKKNTSLGVYGLLVRGGTGNQMDGPPNTPVFPYLVAWFKSKDGSGSGSTGVTISNCANLSGAPFSVNINNSSPTATSFSNLNAMTANTCNASVTVNSITYNSPFSINTASAQPITSMVTINTGSLTANSVPVVWGAVANSAFYYLSITTLAGAPIGETFPNVSSTSASISVNPQLTPSGNYIACFFSFNRDSNDNTTVFSNINYSYRCTTFTYTLPVTSVELSFSPPLIDGSKMQIGETYTVTATAKNGAIPLTGISFSWSELQSGFTTAVFNGNGTGTITPKRLLSTYGITATAQGSGVSGSANGLKIFGLQVVGGTLTTNNTPNANGLYFNAFFKDKNSNPAIGATVGIACSGGVNTSVTLSAAAAEEFLLLPTVPNNPNCVATITYSGVPYQTPAFIINTSQNLPFTTNIIASTPMPGQVELNWPAVAGASHYQVNIYVSGPPTSSPLLTTNTITFTGSISASTVCITAYNLNPSSSSIVSSGQPNVSERCQFF